MLTKDLPERVTGLKVALKKCVEQFNQETGLSVCGVMIEALFTNEKVNDIPVIKGYQVGVSIEL